jgi:hypothetical protein
MATDIKVFRCGHGHVLGLVTRNGRGLRRLLIYRQAVDELHLEGTEAPEVMAVTESEVIDIRCSVDGCGEIKTWIPGEAEMRAIVSRYLQRVTEREELSIMEGRSKAYE